MCGLQESDGTVFINPARYKGIKTLSGRGQGLRKVCVYFWENPGYAPAIAA